MWTIRTCTNLGNINVWKRPFFLRSFCNYLAECGTVMFLTIWMSRAKDENHMDHNPVSCVWCWNYESKTNVIADLLVVLQEQIYVTLVSWSNFSFVGREKQKKVFLSFYRKHNFGFIVAQICHCSSAVLVFPIYVRFSIPLSFQRVCILSGNFTLSKSPRWRICLLHIKVRNCDWDGKTNLMIRVKGISLDYI